MTLKRMDTKMDDERQNGGVRMEKEPYREDTKEFVWRPCGWVTEGAANIVLGRRPQNVLDVVN